jgi:type I restriction enzyme S subunit
LPKQWQVKRLKYLAAPSRRRLFEKPDDATYLGLEQIESKTGKLLLDNPVESVESNMGVFERGDVLFGKLRPYLAKVAAPSFAGVCTTELTVYRPKPEVQSEYLKYQMLVGDFIDFVNALAYGTKMPRVSEEQMSELRLAVPPLSEQQAIATFLDRETARIDTLIGHKERLIALLEEKRQAVISHALTRGLDSSAPRKDSGVPAVGAVPAHWEVRRNKFLFREIDQRSLAGDEDLLTVSHISGVTPRSEKPDVTMFLAESNEGYKVCQPGDLVINTMWAFMGAVAVSPQEGCVSPSYNVYRPRDPSSFVPAYLDLLYRVDAYKCEILRFSKGIWHSRLRLYPDAFLNLLTVKPPRAEQEQILKYIESQTATGRALLATLQDSIGRLREYRTALISAAVTGQIDVRGEVTP